MRVDAPRSPAGGLFRRVTLAAPLCAVAVFVTTADGGVDGLQTPAGEPVPGLTPEQLDRFFDGQEDFNHTFTADEGVGPIFNKQSCGNCHNSPVGGSGAQAVTRFFVFSKSGFDPLAELGGPLLQAGGTALECLEELPAFAETQTRTTRGSLGYGLLEAIPDSAIEANEIAQSGESYAGHVHWTQAFEDIAEMGPDRAPLRAGRFGWKGNIPTILSFTGDATRNEMGITNRLFPEENDPNGINAPDLGVECEDPLADPEDGPDENGRHFIDRATDFQRFLAAPPQTPQSGMTGEQIFNDLGCATCHVPEYTTSDDPELEAALRNKTIRPYSDLLVHNMGVESDLLVDGMAGQYEVITTPLWGLRLKDSYLHDGSVQGGTFEDKMLAVIEYHGAFFSEASFAYNNFQTLSEQDKQYLYDFLNSLGRREFDTDGDNDVQLDDFHDFGGESAMLACFGNPTTPDEPCAVHDVDQDGDVDLDDFAWFMEAYDGPRPDCNTNGILDLQEILEGTLVDADYNGIADSCEPTCAEDIDGTNSIGVSDLLEMLGQWGPCPEPTLPCSGDLNGDDAVGVSDLLELLGAWGPCD